MARGGTLTGSGGGVWRGGVAGGWRRAASEVPYELAAQFARFVSDQYGPDGFVALYRSTAPHADFDTACRNSLGVSAAEITAAFLAEPQTCGFDPWECGDAVGYAFAGAQIETLQASISCGGLHPWGAAAIDDTGRASDAVFDAWRIDVRAAETVSLRGNRPMALVPCGSCERRAENALLLDPPHTTDAVALSPGAYTLFAEPPGALVGLLELEFETLQ